MKKKSLLALTKKTKNETITLLLDILVDLKNNYGYDERVIDKVLDSVKYQIGLYKDEN